MTDRPQTVLLWAQRREKPVWKDKSVSASVRPCFGLEAQCATVTPKSASRAWNQSDRSQTGGEKSRGKVRGRKQGRKQAWTGHKSFRQNVKKERKMQGTAVMVKWSHLYPHSQQMQIWQSNIDQNFQESGCLLRQHSDISLGPLLRVAFLRLRKKSAKYKLFFFFFLLYTLQDDSEKRAVSHNHPWFYSKSIPNTEVASLE